MADERRLRIGELSRRVGVSPELLRAWETRYGLLSPERTTGGLRLFSDGDEQRVRLMLRHLADGLSAAEAARLVKQGGDQAAPADLEELAQITQALERGCEGLDEAAVHTELDQLFKAFPLPVTLSAVILPLLHQLGDRWASGRISVAQEHFASNILGGRLRGLTPGWGTGVGPLAVLACPPGERHDLGLLCFGLALREHGWRIAYFGADTPLQDLARAADEIDPAIVVLAAISRRRFNAAREEILTLRSRVRVAIAGAGASRKVAESLGVEALGEDLVGQAADLRP